MLGIKELMKLVGLVGLLCIVLIGCAPSSEPNDAPLLESSGSPVEPKGDGGHVTAPAPAGHNRPGPASEKIYFKAFHVDRAPLDIQSGAMDLYLFSLKTNAARELADTEGLRIYDAPATSISLILNPAPSRPGEINPFANPEIRHAVQYLVNREFIVNDIYRGMAVPMTTQVSPLDYDFLTVYDIVRSADIRYDPQYARQIIKREMEKAGATLIEGVWTYNERPVRLKFITRVEDERREVGDLIRAELTQAGFQVEPGYRQFAPAVLSVYSSDPAAFEWHLYTEGWGRGAPDRYDFATINHMSAPWLGNMPGWKEVGFWQYDHNQLDTLGKRLFTGDFESQAERNEIYREMTKLAMDESVRVWLATVVNSFPAQEDLKGVTLDLVSGPRSPWTLREAYKSDKDNLTVGHLWVWTERTTWNPIGGLGDVYSVDIWRNLSDAPLWNHPFSGIPQPFRASFDVTTSGPRGRLSVPPDANIWDVEQNEWRPVGSGLEATSRVIFDYSKYFQSTWHHQQPISMADVLYSISQGYEMAYDERKSRIETALGVTSRPFLETFAGYKVLDENRLEVYVNFWHFEENYIASYASPTGLNVPWELALAMDKLVFEQRRAAYSDTAAFRFQVPWLSLVMDRDARLVRRVLKDLIERSELPVDVFKMNGETFVTKQDAVSRYQASLDWFDAYGHLVISNGPFFLQNYDPPAQFAELRAFREENYPFRPGDWLFGSTEGLSIDRVDVPNIIIGKGSTLHMSVHGSETPRLDYVLIDANSREIVSLGKADEEAGDFTIKFESQITEKLEPGLHQLFLLASSDDLAVVSERKVDLLVEMGQ